MIQMRVKTHEGTKIRRTHTMWPVVAVLNDAGDRTPVGSASTVEEAERLALAAFPEALLRETTFMSDPSSDNQPGIYAVRIELAEASVA